MRGAITLSRRAREEGFLRVAQREGKGGTGSGAEGLIALLFFSLRSRPGFYEVTEAEMAARSCAALRRVVVK